MTQSDSKFKVVWIGVFVILSMHSYAQHSEDDIIQRIKSYQITDDSFYDPGLFPSQRSWFFFSKPVKDNTLFFNASIVSTLNMIQAELKAENQKVVDLIGLNASKIYWKYKSRNGDVTYNFWQTASPDIPFPNGSKLISNEKTRLPDDFDTTILTALAQDQNDSIDQLIRKKMIDYSERADRKEVELITPLEYEDTGAYEVWFGKNMPQTFDICVMSNVMLFVFDRGFELNKHDLATIQLILEMIRNEDHMERPSKISHHSSSSALILYHVARLMAKDDCRQLSAIRESVIEDLHSLLDQVENEVEKVMILSSLYRLDVSSLQSINAEKFKEDASTFEFFSFDPGALGMTSFLPTFRWVCEAYNWTLLLEMIALEKKAKH